MSFVSNWGAGLSDRVDKLHSHHPLVDGQLNFAGEFVDVSDEGTKDFSASGISRGTNGIDDMAGEVGIKSLRHSGGFCGVLV